MGKYIKANLDPSMTDKEIKETVRLLINGPYTVKICKGCGMYWQSIVGDLETSEIINECDYCPEIDVVDETDTQTIILVECRVEICSSCQDDKELDVLCEVLEELDIQDRIGSLVRTLIGTRTATEKLVVKVK